MVSYDYGNMVMGSLANDKARRDRLAEEKRLREQAEEDAEYATAKAEQGGGLGALIGAAVPFFLSGGLSGLGTLKGALSTLSGAAQGYSGGAQHGKNALGATLAGVGGGIGGYTGVTSALDKNTMDAFKTSMDVLKDMQPISEMQLTEMSTVELQKLKDTGALFEVPAGMDLGSILPEFKGVKYLIRRPQRPIFDVPLPR